MIWLLVLPGILLGGLAQSMVKANVARFGRVAVSAGLTGAQVARAILDARGLTDVRIEPAQGVLGDHYDPRSRTLRLSRGVYGVPSVAAAGIAAHEAGHAIQDADDYPMLELRSRVVPVIQTVSGIAPLVFFAGLLLGIDALTWAGALAFGATSLFSLITLPVEFDASNRAMALLAGLGIIRDPEEAAGVRKVLRAAALTYVAAAVAALAGWLFYLLLARRG